MEKLCYSTLRSVIQPHKFHGITLRQFPHLYKIILLYKKLQDVNCPTSGILIKELAIKPVNLGKSMGKILLSHLKILIIKWSTIILFDSQEMFPVPISSDSHCPLCYNNKDLTYVNVGLPRCEVFLVCVIQYNWNLCSFSPRFTF